MTLLKIVLFTLFFHMSYATARVVASLDALDHGAGAFEVGVLMCLLALFPTFLAIPCGRWMDRVGGRKPFVVAFLLLFLPAVFSLLLPVARFGTFPLYVLCSVVGIGFMYMQMAGLELVGFVSTPETRMGNYAMLSLAYAGSGLVSPVITGHLIDNVGHTSVYAYSAACSLLGFILFLAFRRIVPTAWTKGERKPAAARKGGAFDLMRDGRVRHVIIIAATVSMAWELENYMFPVYGHRVGLSATEIGWLLGVFFSATFIVRAVIPFVSKFLNERQCMLLVLAVGGASYMAFPFFETLPPLLAVAFVLGLALGASQPNVMSLLQRVSPPGRFGEALGIRTMARNAAHASLPMIFGAITAAFGPFWIFIAQGALMGVAAVSAGAHLGDDGEKPAREADRKASK